MKVNCKPLIVLLLGLFLFLPTLSTIYASSNNNEEWETGYSVGKFVRSDQPDQISKIHYRAINGTVEKFNVIHIFNEMKFNGILIFQVDSNNDTILEIRVPRNHPYALDPSTYGGPLIIATENDSTVYFEYKTDVGYCFYVFSIPLNGSSEIEVLWTELLSHRGGFPKVDVPDYCIPHTVVEDVPLRKDGTISPLHQFRAGIKAEDIVCNEGLDLLIRIDGKPYCAAPSTVKELNERWNKGLSGN